MTTTIETDLKEILGEFKQEFVKINQRLDKIDETVTDLKVNQVRMEERLSGQINLLDEKVSGLDKRIENQEFTSRGILIGLIVVVLGGAAKVFGFLPNP
jgi:hypothetical protein